MKPFPRSYCSWCECQGVFNWYPSIGVSFGRIWSLPPPCQMLVVQRRNDNLERFYWPRLRFRERVYIRVLWNVKFFSWTVCDPYYDLDLGFSGFILKSKWWMTRNPLNVLQRLGGLRGVEILPLLLSCIVYCNLFHGKRFRVSCYGPCIHRLFIIDNRWLS